MKFPGVGRTRQLLKRAREKLGTKLPILLYHRVADDDCDPWQLCVSPANFAAQMHALRRETTVLRLEEFAGIMEKREKIPSKACIVTFDDGYADNLHLAEPALRDSRVPATIFMTSGSVGRTREFWWDELEKIFLRPGRLPSSLAIRVGSQSHEWQLAGDADYTRAAFALHQKWSAEGKDAPTARQRIYQSVYHLLQQLSRETRDPIIDQIVDWAGASRDLRPSHRALSNEETRQLSCSEWISIGAHTITHQSLSNEPHEIQREEIAGSKIQLEALIGRPVNTFSYPYGHHTDETAEIARQAGFRCACACMEKTASSVSDIFRLPRVMVRDWSKAEFVKRLRRWLG
jgi:peptidoglycan/xylan/chitin deacetylase (PgdA/CDA1 family)